MIPPTTCAINVKNKTKQNNQPALALWKVLGNKPQVLPWEGIQLTQSNFPVTSNNTV